MVNLLRQLGNNFRLIAFTNTIDLHWQELHNEARYTFLPLFAKVFASHQLGLAKPTTQSFECVLDHLDLSPEQAIFIDDTATNIVAAEKCGLKSVLFRSCEELLQEVRAWQALDALAVEGLMKYAGLAQKEKNYY